MKITNEEIEFLAHNPSSARTTIDEETPLPHSSEEERETERPFTSLDPTKETDGWEAFKTEEQTSTKQLNTEGITKETLTSDEESLTQSDRDATDSSSNPQTNKKKRRRTNYYLSGTWLFPYFRTRNVLLFLFIVLLLVCDTYMGYLRINKIKKIDRLERALKEVSNKQLFLYSEISNTNREKSVEERLQEKGSTLAPTSDPPFVIYNDNKDKPKQKN